MSSGPKGTLEMKVGAEWRAVNPPAEGEGEEEDDEEEEEEEEEEEGDEEEEDSSGSDPGELIIDEDGRVEYAGPRPAAVRVWDGVVGEAVAGRCERWCADAAVKKVVGSGKAYSRGDTFFVRSTDTPRCGLEEVALQIFKMHTEGCTFDPSRSGAEWWTLVLDADSEVGWHWDKDYALESSMKLNVYPQIGTVTYLSDHGVPTAVARMAAPPLVTDALPPSSQGYYLCYPKRGRHLAFDGRFLHGSKEGFAHSPLPKGERRTTLLVNVWLNHKPVAASRYPLGRISEAEQRGHDAAQWHLATAEGERKPVEAHSVEAASPAALKAKPFAYDFTTPSEGQATFTLHVPVDKVGHGKKGGVFGVHMDGACTLVSKPRVPGAAAPKAKRRRKA